VWVRNYSGGDCFFASGTSMNGAKPEIEGFGENVDAFKQLLSDFTLRFQIEPEINLRLISGNQCPVTQFLGKLASGSGNPPGLSLVKDELLDRDTISGQVQIQPSRQTYLLLVDQDGIVHNLDRILMRDGDKAKFSIAPGVGTAKSADKARAAPQLLIAFATSQTVEAMKATDPVPAQELLPRILSEMKSKQMDGAATARYFRIHG
jgi:hypothetical protein